jgi:uncharacterized protein (DUF1800 family)
LLKRTMFGVKKADLEAFKNQTISQVEDTLLTVVPSSAPPVNTYNDSIATDPNVPSGQTWVNAPFTDGTINSRRYTSFKAWWTGLMINQNRSITEKLTLFWHNHFATETVDVADARFVYKHHALLRSMALGNFKTLVKEVTIDPAMLRYLNGTLNTKTAPDENYARELQELFTLGKGPNSLYTEDDVKAVAKVLTGYRADPNNINSYFDPARHDTGNKQFSAFYNNIVITGKTGAQGASELDELLNLIFSKDEVAMFICRKLYRFFVYYDIDVATEANVITPLANIFRQNNYELKPVLEALFRSEHFFDVLNRGCVIKSPLDFLIGHCREFGMVFPDAVSDTANAYIMWDYLRQQSANMQQNLGDPPNVAGWPAYYQEPQFHEIWINSDTLPKRNQFTDLMVSTGYTRNNKKILIDPVAFAAQFSLPGDPNVLIEESLELIYSISVSQQLKDFLKSILLSGQTNDYYWTNAWNAHRSNPADASAKLIVASRLQSMYKYLMNLAEYQLS